MKIVGITGGSGSGKTTVAKLFEKKNMYRIDADAVAREVVEKGSPALEKIKYEFGSGVICPDGTLNRKSLADIVFNDTQKLEKLNNITHGYIIERIEKLLLQCDCEWAIIDAAALFESGLDKKCDAVIAVIADTAVRKKRIMERDNLNEKSAAARIKAQKEAKFYVIDSDFVIVNNSDEYNLKKETEKIFKCLRDDFEENI